MDKRMLQKFLADAQKVKDSYDEKISNLEQKVFEHTHGKDHVFVQMNGQMQILELKIHDDLLEEKDMMQDLVVEAINETIQKVLDEKKKLEAMMVPPMGV